MVTTRTLERRRAVLAPSHRPRARRRRVSVHIFELADHAADRLRVGPLLRLSAALTVTVCLLVFYLVLVAQTTGASYVIQQQRAAQQQLNADLEQQRYQEATLTSPASVDAQARAAGLSRVAPGRYLPYAVVTVDVVAPIGPEPPDVRPPWQVLAADLLQMVGGAAGGRG